jgi:hypothetical protein
MATSECSPLPRASLRSRKAHHAGCAQFSPIWRHLRTKPRRVLHLIVGSGHEHVNQGAVLALEGVKQRRDTIPCDECAFRARRVDGVDQSVKLADGKCRLSLHFLRR